MTDTEIKSKFLVIGAKPLRPTSHLYSKYKEISILDAAKKNAKKYVNLAKSKPALQLIEVVLAANRNYNKVVRPNIDRLNKIEDLTDFDELTSYLKKLSKKEFFELWGHRDEKKYAILKAILNRIPRLRKTYPSAKSDFELLNCWANDVVLGKYRSDIIGEIKYVAIATIQHLRMSFGANTVKPDQRVKEVLKREFDFTAFSDIKVVEMVERIGEICGQPTLVVDQVFVNYGSGYYNLSENKVAIEEVARRLKKLDVDERIISEATGISTEIIKGL